MLVAYIGMVPRSIQENIPTLFAVGFGVLYIILSLALERYDDILTERSRVSQQMFDMCYPPKITEECYPPKITEEWLLNGTKLWQNKHLFGFNYSVYGQQTKIVYYSHINMIYIEQTLHSGTVTKIMLGCATSPAHLIEYISQVSHEPIKNLINQNYKS